MEFSFRIHLFTTFVSCIKVSSLKKHLFTHFDNYSPVLSEHLLYSNLYKYTEFLYRFMLKWYNLESIQVVIAFLYGWCDCSHCLILF